MVRVSLVKGTDRYENVLRALNLVESDIEVVSRSKILVKPNLGYPKRPVAITHVDAIRAVLDFLRQKGAGKVCIGEGSGAIDTMQAFLDAGYLELGKSYDVEFLDLDHDDYVEVQVYNRQLRPFFLRVAKTVVESNYRISVCPPKTHDSVIVTLSLKNMVVGSLIWDEQGHDKKALHQGYRAMNLSLFELAKIIPPHLSVIDGFLGMEGNGPAFGEPVELGIAIASTDFLAADCVAAKIMGFDPSGVGYLNYCEAKGLGTSNLSKMQLLGSTIEECQHPFKPHATYGEQLKWQTC